jgi:hypothetical protein
MTVNQHRVILAEPQEIPLVIQTIQEEGVAGKESKLKDMQRFPWIFPNSPQPVPTLLGTRNMTRNKSRLVPL